jgi:hypothetical protein
MIRETVDALRLRHGVADEAGFFVCVEAVAA